MMENTLFEQPETFTCEATAIRHRRKAALLPLTAIVTVGLTAFLGVVGFSEYGLFHEVFDFLKGPSQPGEAGQWSVGLLALTGTLMMLGFHVYAEGHPNTLSVRLIDRCAGIILPIYALGAGLAVASLIYFNGADALVTQAADSSRDLFSGPSIKAGTPMVDSLIASFPVIFAIGCGGLAIVNLMVSHRLMGAIWANVQRIAADWHAASEAKAAITAIRAAQRQFSELAQKRDALLAVDARSHEVAAAHEILGAISTAINPYETWLTNQHVRGGTPENRLALPQSNLDPKELAKRVAALRAITPKSILASVRGLKE
jgi:hypothetical protein